MHIVVFHLLNDYSGSPKVLRSVIERLIADGNTVDLYTSRGGTLDAVSSPSLSRHDISYSFGGPRLLTAARYIWSQLITFFSALRYAFRPDTEFYINTILPVGAAIAGRLTGKHITLHCHEAVISRNGMYPILSRIMLRLANKVICVSRFQSEQLPKLPAKLSIHTIPNTLPNQFINSLQPDPETAFTRRRVLMLCSLKSYKGIPEFLHLASLLPNVNFSLVINDTRRAIDTWLLRNGITPSPNVTIHPCQAEVAPFYNEASIVVNLSNPSLFIETFGMTALEARACQLPVIVPTVGGIAELITDGIDGYHIDCRDTDRLTRTITTLLSDRDLYLRLARGSFPAQCEGGSPNLQ